MNSNTIKSILFSSIFLIITQYSFCQKNEAYQMIIDGVKVIVQPSGNDIVEIQTIIKGGVQNYPADKAGIESLAMRALTECGTAKDDKNSFKNKLDKVDAEMYGNSAMDFASFRMNCIKSDFNTVWPLYVDALTTPAFNEKEFARIKQDAINALKARASNPDYAISKFAREVAFAGKDYAKSPEGKEETVMPLTVAETKDYYKSLLTKSRIVVVVVADLDSELIRKNVSAMLASIPAGKPFEVKKTSYSPKQNTFKSEKKDFATNYIQAVTGAPLPGSDEYNAFTLAMAIYYDKNFLEVRTNNGLSYAPYTYLDNGLSPSANIVVSTTDPNKYIGVEETLITKIKKDGFTSDELKNEKSTYLTYFYYEKETNSAQAYELASFEVVNNDWHKALTFNEDVKKVSVSDLNNAFNKYIKNLTWVYMGDPSKVKPALFTQNTSMKKLPLSKVNTGTKN